MFSLNLIDQNYLPYGFNIGETPVLSYNITSEGWDLTPQNYPASTNRILSYRWVDFNGTFCPRYPTGQISNGNGANRNLNWTLNASGTYTFTKNILIPHFGINPKYLKYTFGVWVRYQLSSWSLSNCSYSTTVKLKKVNSAWTITDLATVTPASWVSLWAVQSTAVEVNNFAEFTNITWVAETDLIYIEEVTSITHSGGSNGVPYWYTKGATLVGYLAI